MAYFYEADGTLSDDGQGASAEPVSYAYSGPDAAASDTSSTNGQPYGQSWGGAAAAQISAIVGGYVSKLADVDIIRKLSTVGQPTMGSNHGPINPNGQGVVVNPRTGTVALNIGQLMPLILLGLVVFLAKKKN